MGSMEHQNYESEAFVRYRWCVRNHFKNNIYYRPHISYGIDEVKVEVGGGNPKLLSFYQGPIKVSLIWGSANNLTFLYTKH
ncbi:hypothetical protein D3C73_841380 [compost metagenome]